MGNPPWHSRCGVEGVPSQGLHILSILLLQGWSSLKIQGEEFLNYLKKGKIINIASKCGLIGYLNFISYNVSKAGIISLTKTLAVGWAKYNILANAIAPGFVKTEMTRYVWSNPKRLSDIMSRTPLKRITEAEEIIGAIIFLSSSASDFITGAILPFDGGMLVV